MKLIENNHYVVKDKNDNDMIWKFVRYETYSSLPTDCIFEHISGSEYLVKDSSIKPEFAFPEMYVGKLTISPCITEEVEKEFFIKNLDFIKTRRCFIENLTIRDSIISINAGLVTEQRMLNIYEELLSLYVTDRRKYENDIDNANMEIKKIKSFDRSFLIKILETYDESEKFRDIVEQYL